MCVHIGHISTLMAELNGSRPNYPLIAIDGLESVDKCPKMHRFLRVLTHAQMQMPSNKYAVTLDRIPFMHS